MNPNTIARAYRELEVLGLVEKRRTAGTYVADPGSPLAREERLKILAERIDQLLAESELLGVGHRIEHDGDKDGRDKSHGKAGESPGQDS